MDVHLWNPTSRKERETWGTRHPAPGFPRFDLQPDFLSSPQTAPISPNPHIRKQK
jgi:hypothetical protein